MKSCMIDNPADMRAEQTGLSVWWLRQKNGFATEPMPLPQPARNAAPGDLFATELMPVAQATARSTSEVNADLFATEPLPALAIRSGRQSAQEQEEEWHTSFEQAISERAARVSQQLRRLSTTALDGAFTPATDPLPCAERSVRPRRSIWRAQRRAILFTCLGICLFLLGFDLMGLLMLLR
jgi:hypothetical protein